MAYSYNPTGVCPRKITFDVDKENKVHDVKFMGGCYGNHEGIAHLVEGMDAEEVIGKLEGIECGFKGTSCPDQLAKALRAHLVKYEKIS